MRSSRIPVLALCCATAAGCYTYTPATLDEIQPEQDVRARLSPEAVARLAPGIPVAGRDLDGRLIRRDATDVLLLVPVNTDVRGARVETLHQRVRVPASGIVDVELRRLDRLKTGLVIGGGLAVLTAIAVATLKPGGDSERPGGGEPGGEIVVPLRLFFLRE